MKKECGSSESKQCDSKQCCWCKVSIAFGLSNGLFILIIGLLGTFYGCCLEKIQMLSGFYPGLEATVSGSFLGAFSAFISMFLFFRVAGWIYQALSKCCNKCCCNKGSCSSNEKKCDKTLDT
jgi:hypothetical protein